MLNKEMEREDYSALSCAILHFKQMVDLSGQTCRFRGDSAVPAVIQVGTHAAESESKQMNGRKQRDSDKGGHRWKQKEGRGIKVGIEATK